MSRHGLRSSSGKATKRKDDRSTDEEEPPSKKHKPLKPLANKNKAKRKLPASPAKKRRPAHQHDLKGEDTDQRDLDGDGEEVESGLFEGEEGEPRHESRLSSEDSRTLLALSAKPTQDQPLYERRGSLLLRLTPSLSHRLIPTKSGEEEKLKPSPPNPAEGEEEKLQPSPPNGDEAGVMKLLEDGAWRQSRTILFRRGLKLKSEYAMDAKQVATIEPFDLAKGEEEASRINAILHEQSGIADMLPRMFFTANLAMVVITLGKFRANVGPLNLHPVHYYESPTHRFLQIPLKDQPWHIGFAIGSPTMAEVDFARFRRFYVEELDRISIPSARLRTQIAGGPASMHDWGRIFLTEPTAAIAPLEMSCTEVEWDAVDHRPASASATRAPGPSFVVKANETLHFYIVFPLVNAKPLILLSGSTTIQ